MKQYPTTAEIFEFALELAERRGTDPAVELRWEAARRALYSVIDTWRETQRVSIPEWSDLESSIVWSEAG